MLRSAEEQWAKRAKFKADVARVPESLEKLMVTTAIKVLENAEGKSEAEIRAALLQSNMVYEALRSYPLSDPMLRAAIAAREILRWLLCL